MYQRLWGYKHRLDPTELLVKFRGPLGPHLLSEIGTDVLLPHPSVIQALTSYWAPVQWASCAQRCRNTTEAEERPCSQEAVFHVVWTTSAPDSASSCIFIVHTACLHHMKTKAQKGWKRFQAFEANKKRTWHSNLALFDPRACTVS